MKTLVTGATGFVGRHLVKALHEQGRDIRCFVRKTSQTGFLQQLGVELFYGELEDQDSLIKALHDIDILYHAAGEVFALEEEKYSKVNISGLKNILEACSSGSVKKIIHFSSSSATGPNQYRDVPVNEDSPCHPITPYGKSKLAGEKIIEEFSIKYNVPAIIIKPPLVYGSWLSDSSRVLMFLQLIHKGLFNIFGDGNNLLSLCYIDNLIHGVLLAEKENRRTFETYFIADARPYTLNEIAETITQEQGKPLPVSHLPLWSANMLSIGLSIASQLFGFTSPLSRNTVMELKNNWFVDVSKAQMNLGYQPIVDFRDGVKITVEWFMNHYLPAQK